MRAIFISYRRDDTDEQAGRLLRDLARSFGEHVELIDASQIEPGRSLREAIDEQMASCGVLVSLIGKSWVDATNEAGQRWLDDPRDFVRMEMASALRQDVPVVPVLVQGAAMPLVGQLPAELAELAFCDGLELSHARWDADVAALATVLSHHVPPLRVRPRVRIARRRRWRGPLSAGLALGVLGLGGIAYGIRLDGASRVRRDVAALHAQSEPRAGLEVVAGGLQRKNAPPDRAAFNREPPGVEPPGVALPGVAPEPAPRARTSTVTPEVTLISWWSSDEGDNLLTSEPPWLTRPGVRQGSYAFSSAEGKIFDPNEPQPAGTVPLSSWRSDGRKGYRTEDHRTTSAPGWRVSVAANGGKVKWEQPRESYQLYRREGYVYDPAAPQPAGTRPLFTWFNRARGDYLTTTQPRWCMALPKRNIFCDGSERSYTNGREGYYFVRLEGFVH